MNLGGFPMTMSKNDELNLLAQLYHTANKRSKRNVEHIVFKYVIQQGNPVTDHVLALLIFRIVKQELKSFKAGQGDFLTDLMLILDYELESFPRLEAIAIPYSQI